MKLDFVKLHGLGNDFVVIDDFSNTKEITPEQAAVICDRHFGVGADGLILVRPSKRPECAAYMHYINSDGSLAEMCGNGVRCFAKFLVDRGYVSGEKKHFIADTLAGPRPIEFSADCQGKLDKATVNMGQPLLAASKIPTMLEENSTTDTGISFIKDVPVSSPWGNFNFTCVSMGNPHAVCFIDDWAALPDELFCDPQVKNLTSLKLDTIGSFYEQNPVFPQKANIEFVSIDERGISMRVFERGCGETLACGTGACAVSIAATLTERAERTNIIHLRGGVLTIDWAEDDHVFMTGAACESFTGSLLLN